MNDTFIATAFIEVILIGALVLDLLADQVTVWPPPESGVVSWPFWYVWGSTVAIFAGIMVTGTTDWNTFVYAHWSRFILGGFLAGTGTVLAMWGVLINGLSESGGLEGTLTTSGPYRFTRNPQYVGDILLLIGTGLIVNSGKVWILVFLACVCLALAPYLEEPWLEETYGEDYRTYKQLVPRFIDVRF